MRAVGALLVGLLITACGTSSGTAPVPTLSTALRNPVPTLPNASALRPPNQTTSPSSPQPGGSVTTLQGTLRFRPQTIRDPAAGNIAALTFLVPDGWQAQGAVQWLPEWERLAHLATTVSDPATGITIDWLPIQDFIWFDAPAGFSAPIGGNYQGKAYVPPISDPGQFVSQFWMPNVLAHLRNARLVNTTQVPAVAQAFVAGFGGPAQAGAYRLRYEFEQNGQTWQEDVFFALLYSAGQGLTSWYVNFAYAVQAPTGVIDANEGVISTVIASRTTTPEWEGNYRLVQRLFTQGLQQQIADTEAFGRLLAQYRAQSQQLQAEVTAERQASQDRIADLQGQSLEGIDTYVSPIDGSYVELPQRWVEYWVNPKGEYLTSDTPGFDPNQVDNEGWQRLTLRR
jgi:hypothetical protein